MAELDILLKPKKAIKHPKNRNYILKTINQGTQVCYIINHII